MVLGGRRGQADDRRDGVPRAATDQVPDRGVRGLVGEQRLGEGADPEHGRREPFPVEVQARRGCAPGDRAADVDEVAVASRPSPQHRVGEDDRVRLGPRDVLAEGGSHRQLVRRTGPRGATAHRHVRVHHRPGVLGGVAIEMHEFGVEQVERGDVERRRDRDTGATVGETHREVQPGPTVVQAAVDVRGGHVEELARVHRLGRADEDAHRELRRGTALAVERRTVVVGEGERAGHGRILSRRTAGV